jgi:hypothetical protein
LIRLTLTTVSDMKERPKPEPKYLATDPSAYWTLYSFGTLAEARKLVKERAANGIKTLIWKRV